MPLCQYCDNIPAKLFSFRREDQCTHDHQPNLPALQASAAKGCPGCRLFHHAIESSASEHAGKYALRKSWSTEDPIRLLSTKFGYQDVRVGWEQAGQFRSYEVPEEWENDPTPPTHDPQAKNGSTYLEYEALLIQRWSKLCQDRHGCCACRTDDLPTRLIDVGTSNNPKLSLVLGAEIESTNRLYLALSHCWGGTMPSAGRTTSATLDRHMESIAAADLPLTFQQFMEIARRLEIQYVWIDSLCIIQDSPSDWEKEAALMASVYSNAHLTIAASGSSDGRGGCHVVDDVRSFGPLDIECTVSSEASSTEPSTITKRFRLWSRDTYPVGQILAADPLMQRGWTLQERELSPRIVHYSHDTIRWECRELRATVEFPWADPNSFDVGRFFDGGSSTRPTTIGLPINNSRTLDDDSRRILSWFELVHRYTSRALTKQTDILPALSGIARAMAEDSSDEYCAGLWKSQFAHCLLWASDWHVGRGFRQHSRPSDYLAPSWSWASIKGPIEYLSWINGYWHSFNTNGDPAYLPKLVDVSLQASSDPYGMLKAGSIRIEGRVGMAFTMQEAYAAPKDHLNVSFTQGPQDRFTMYRPNGSGGMEKVGEIRYDIPLCSDCVPVGTIRLFWLLCCMTHEKSEDGSMRTFAIALQGSDWDEVPSSQTTLGIPTKSRRVGVAWGIDASFWESGITTTLTIV